MARIFLIFFVHVIMLHTRCIIEILKITASPIASFGGLLLYNPTYSRTQAGGQMCQLNHIAIIGQPVVCIVFLHCIAAAVGFGTMLLYKQRAVRHQELDLDSSSV